MKSDLLPCPFCGGDARLDQRQTQSLWNSSDATFSHVTCDDCDIQGNDFCDDPSGEEAIEWWNTRVKSAPPSPDAELVDLLNRAFAELEDWRMSFPDANSHETDKILVAIDAKLASLR